MQRIEPASADGPDRTIPSVTCAVDRRPSEAGLYTVQTLCREVLPGLPVDHLRSRQTFIHDPLLCVAERDGTLVGFKLAYRTDKATLFSWLGGVIPSARRLGIARELMRLQHEEARRLGYGMIETRTRTSNQAMLILNLQAGFEIVGLETDALGRFVAIQRLRLARTDTLAGMVQDDVTF